jgi:outer membrane cobalamin receptor
VTTLLLASCAPGLCGNALAHDVAAPDADQAGASPTIVVTASRTDLLGKAATASEGTVTRAEVDLRPIYRASQLFEAIPCLVVTIHSGEGKAQQYLIRGYNLTMAPISPVSSMACPSTGRPTRMVRAIPISTS